MLKIHNIKFEWSNKIKFHFDYEINKGEIVTIEGKSGVGKSTLLDLIGGFLMPISGKILWEKKTIHDLPVNIRPISSIFQNNNLFDHLSCRMNASLGISSSGKLNKFEKNNLYEIFEELEISDLLERFPNEISGGQKARIVLARSLLSKKPIILMDEPVSSLDDETRVKTLKVIKKNILKYNMTLLIVSHNIEDRKLLSARKIKLA